MREGQGISLEGIRCGYRDVNWREAVGGVGSHGEEESGRGYRQDLNRTHN